MNPPDQDDNQSLLIVDTQCLKCKSPIQFPPGYQPEVRTILQCPTCSAFIGIRAIDDIPGERGKEQTFEYGYGTQTRKKFTFVIIPEAAIEELELSGRLEGIFPGGEK